MTFCDLIIYNDNPLLIRLCTELDLLPNFERFHLRRVWHADRGRLLLRTPGPIPLGLAYVLHVETNLFLNLSLFFSRLCSSKIPRYFLDFASYMYIRLQLLAGHETYVYSHNADISCAYENHLKHMSRYDFIFIFLFHFVQCHFVSFPSISNFFGVRYIFIPTYERHSVFFVPSLFKQEEQHSSS